MSEAITELRRRLGEVHDLANVSELLQWDQQTMMPEGATAVRAEEIATVEGLAHERATAPELGHALERAAAEVAGAPEDSDDACLVRVARRDWDKERRVPGELRSELARAAALGHQAWAQARAASDFARFEPALRETMALARRYTECFPEAACAYDALLDDYEPEMTSREVSALFAQLKDGLLPLVASIAERGETTDSAFLHGDFPVARQRELVREVLGVLGFDSGGWRLDQALHPFAMGLSDRDIRLTTRYDPGRVEVALWGAIHEFGHGLYERGVAPELQRTPLGSGVSLGLHESQSRLWENLVGRSRPFCRFLLPRLRERFPEAFGGVDAERLYRAVNRVAPSLIRVEADEATYCLHVILRYELEQEMIEDRIDLSELPSAWNARMREYLGIEVPDDARGVLQDVHWSGGTIGYFPTYALGNVISAQLWECARAEKPDLDVAIEAGEFAPLREWLRERLHRHGRKFTARETLRRAVGGPIDAEPYLRYLRTKYGEIYGL